jgi:Ceramidase
MNWTEPLDNYCERLDPSFWAEPLNALSNASFIVAGILLILQWRKSPRSMTGLVLVLNVLVIGLGSFLFHTFANRWSSLADVLPITVFIHLYLVLALHTFLGFRWAMAIGATLAFLLLSPFIGRAIATLIGSSAFYVPALLSIFAVAVAARNRTVSSGLCAAGIVFAISIAYRAADLPLCDLHPQGTHARWHLLNGIVLYLLVRVYLRSTAAPSAR